MKAVTIFTNYPPIFVFRPNARGINAGFGKFCVKYEKTMRFCTFLQKILTNFQLSYLSWAKP